MKIHDVYMLDDCLKISFDTTFEKIEYTKMESFTNDSHGLLDCETMKIRFSKPRNTLKLITNEKSNLVILLITEINNVNGHFCFYIDKLKLPNLLEHNKNMNINETNVDTTALFGLGLNKLLSKQDETQNDSNYKYYIKNENISLDIKKKLNGTR